MSAPSSETFTSDGKKKRSKWDQEGEPGKVPDWLQDLMPRTEKPPPGVDPSRFKVIKMEAIQIRALIGKGGETVQDIRHRSGAEVKIDHLPSELVGTVTIVGDVDKTEQMIKDTLTQKGCPLGSVQTSPAGTVNTAPGPPRELQVPAELVGGLIGPGGSSINELRAKAGSQVHISVLPAAAPGGPQIARISGPETLLPGAEALVANKLEELRLARQPKQPPPPPMGGYGMGFPRGPQDGGRPVLPGGMAFGGPRGPMGVPGPRPVATNWGKGGPGPGFLGSQPPPPGGQPPPPPGGPPAGGLQAGIDMQLLQGAPGSFPAAEVPPPGAEFMTGALSAKFPRPGGPCGGPPCWGAGAPKGAPWGKGGPRGDGFDGMPPGPGGGCAVPPPNGGCAVPPPMGGCAVPPPSGGCAVPPPWDPAAAAQGGAPYNPVAGTYPPQDAAPPPPPPAAAGDYTGPPTTGPAFMADL